MKIIFDLVPKNPVKMEPSNINENWPRLDNISDVNFTVHSLLVPCILPLVNVKPTGVLKLFCDHSNSTWESVEYITSRPLTSIAKGPQYALIRNFPNSI